MFSLRLYEFWTNRALYVLDQRTLSRIDEALKSKNLNQHDESWKNWKCRKDRQKRWWWRHRGRRKEGRIKRSHTNRDTKVFGNSRQVPVYARYLVLRRCIIRWGVFALDAIQRWAMCDQKRPASISWKLSKHWAIDGLLADCISDRYWEIRRLGQASFSERLPSDFCIKIFIGYKGQKLWACTRSGDKLTLRSSG